MVVTTYNHVPKVESWLSKFLERPWWVQIWLNLAVYLFIPGVSQFPYCLPDCASRSWLNEKNHAEEMLSLTLSLYWRDWGKERRFSTDQVFQSACPWSMQGRVAGRGDISQAVKKRKKQKQGGCHRARTKQQGVRPRHVYLVTRSASSGRQCEPRISNSYKGAARRVEQGAG